MIETADLEKLIIASLIVNNDFIPQVKAYIKPNDFGNHVRANILQKIIDKQGKFDVFTLGLTKQSQKEVMDWINELPTALNFPLYLNQFLQANWHEKLKNATLKNDYGEVIKIAAQKPRLLETQTMDIELATQNFLDDLESRRNQNIEKYETHLPKMKKYSVLLPGRLWVIAGPSKIGKTTFLLNLIANYLRKNLKVLLMSLEQGPNEIVAKLLQPTTGIEGWKFDLPKSLEKSDYHRLLDAAGKLAQKPLKISQSHNFAAIIDTIHNTECDILFLDYIQIIRQETENLPLEIGNWMVGLKEIAKEKNIPVIVASQQTRKGISPAWSSKIEQNADLVAFIDEAKDKAYYLGIKWNRQGPAGVRIKLHTNLAISLIAQEK